MTREEIRTEIRRLVEEAVRAASAANESAALQATIAELDHAIASLESSIDSHYGMDASTPPGNFEPVFAEDQSDHKTKLDDVGEGFCPFGRVFYSTVTVDSSAKIERGYIYLEVVHPVSSANAPTIYVKGDTAMPAFNSTNDTSKSLIPLYYIDGGRITVDYRSCMSLTIREL